MLLSVNKECDSLFFLFSFSFFLIRCSYFISYYLTKPWKCDDFSLSAIFREFWKFGIQSFQIEGRSFRWLKWPLTRNIISHQSFNPYLKSKNRSRPIVAHFSFYKNKMNILKSCKKLKNTRFYIYEDFSRETASRKVWYHI